MKYDREFVIHHFDEIRAVMETKLGFEDLFSGGAQCHIVANGEYSGMGDSREQAWADLIFDLPIINEILDGVEVVDERQAI